MPCKSGFNSLFIRSTKNLTANRRSKLINELSSVLLILYYINNCTLFSRAPQLSPDSRSSSCSLNSPQRLSDGCQSLDQLDRLDSPSHGHSKLPLPEIPIESSDTQDSDSRFDNVIDDHIYESTDNWPVPGSSPTHQSVPREEVQQRKILPKEGILMRALYSYIGQDEDDLSFEEGDVVRFLDYCDGGWAKALLDEEYGYVPEAYFEPII